MPCPGHWHNAYVALSGIPGIKIANPVIWMVAFQDRVARNKLWKVLKAWTLSCWSVSIYNNFWYTVDNQ